MDSAINCYCAMDRRQWEEGSSRRRPRERAETGLFGGCVELRPDCADSNMRQRWAGQVTGNIHPFEIRGHSASGHEPPNRPLIRLSLSVTSG